LGVGPGGIHAVGGNGTGGGAGTGTVGNAAHAVQPISLAVGAASPAKAGDLAFAGSGNFWSAALAALGLAFLGFFLLLRRREARAPRP
ncbi:MAG: hypothetical protein ACRDY1_15660, partial [Acidimicrobiales bacterium]